MKKAEVKVKNLLELLENKVSKIKTNEGEFISKKDIDLEVLRNMSVSQIIKASNEFSAKIHY